MPEKRDHEVPGRGARGGDGAGRRGSEAGSSGDKARTWQVQVLPSGSDQGSSGEERRD